MDEMWGCKGLRGGGVGGGGGGAVRKVVPALEGCSGINMAEQNGDHLLTLWLECKGHRVIRVGS